MWFYSRNVGRITRKHSDIFFSESASLIGIISNFCTMVQSTFPSLVLLKSFPLCRGLFIDMPCIRFSSNSWNRLYHLLSKQIALFDQINVTMSISKNDNDETENKLLSTQALLLSTEAIIMIITIIIIIVIIIIIIIFIATILVSAINVFKADKVLKVMTGFTIVLVDTIWYW